LKRNRFTEEQIIGVLKEQEVRVGAAGICRKHGISAATFYKWKSKFGGLEIRPAALYKLLQGVSMMAEPATAFDPIDEDASSRAVAEARAQIAAGQAIPMADMVRWLDSWGTPDELPPPPWK